MFHISTNFIPLTQWHNEESCFFHVFLQSLSLIISSRLGKGTTNAQSLVLSLLVSVTLSPCFMYMVSASLGATGWPSTTWTR